MYAGSWGTYAQFMRQRILSTKGVLTVAHILQAFVQKEKGFLPNGEAAVTKQGVFLIEIYSHL